MILAVTGMWPHHAQVLYLAGALCLVLMARHLQDRALPIPASACLLAFAALALSGGWLPDTFASESKSASDRLAALTATSPETTALLAEGASGRYARLGQHDDLGHAEGLGGWTLACPRFHQYPWDSADVLAETLACASEQPYLLVSDGIAPVEASRDSAIWNDYVADVEALLASHHYVCRPFNGGRVCRHV